MYFRDGGHLQLIQYENICILYSIFLFSSFNNLFCRYDKGAYLFLPSYIMRTHGAKQQREAVKRVPKKQIEPIFEV